jgi:hypothetical protein
MKKVYKISKKQARELEALKRMPDSEIDLTDAPEIQDWRKAVRGKFYRKSKASSSRDVEHEASAPMLAELQGVVYMLPQMIGR